VRPTFRAWPLATACKAWRGHPRPGRQPVDAAHKYFFLGRTHTWFCRLRFWLSTSDPKKVSGLFRLSSGFVNPEPVSPVVAPEIAARKGNEIHIAGLRLRCCGPFPFFARGDFIAHFNAPTSPGPTRVSRMPVKSGHFRSATQTRGRGPLDEHHVKEWQPSTAKSKKKKPDARQLIGEQARGMRPSRGHPRREAAGIGAAPRNSRSRNFFQHRFGAAGLGEGWPQARIGVRALGTPA